MLSLYWFALVVGAGMYLFSLFADVTGHGDGSGDTHATDHPGADGLHLLSLRTATYFLFAFGVAGVLLNWATKGQRGIITATISLLLGLSGVALSALTFRWLRRSESGDMQQDSAWIGTSGRVTIPLVGDRDSAGKILVTRGAREHEMLARPHAPDAVDPHRWTTVYIVEMKDGIAYVSPNDELLNEPPPVRSLPGKP